MSGSNQRASALSRAPRFTRKSTPSRAISAGLRRRPAGATAASNPRRSRSGDGSATGRNLSPTGKRASSRAARRRKIENGGVIDDDGGQNGYSSTLWTRTSASTSTKNITNYGFSIKGFSTSLKNLRVVVTRLK